MYAPVVICYHHILKAARPDHWFFRHLSTFEMFRREMAYLRVRYEPISVTEMADRWERGQPFPRRSIVVTFDDGYWSSLEVARVLRELSIPACFFITAGTVDSTFVPSNLRFAHILSTRSVSTVTRAGQTFDLTRAITRRRWYHQVHEELLDLAPRQRNDRLDELARTLGSAPLPADDPDYRFVSSDELREIRRLGMTIGCHGGTHDNLARCNEDELHEEMGRSKERLEAWLGEPPDFFAYPDGRFNRAARHAAQRYYRLAFTIGLWGDVKDRWAYPRQGADGAPLEVVLGWWFPWRARLAHIVKRVMGMA